MKQCQTADVRHDMRHILKIQHKDSKKWSFLICFLVFLHRKLILSPFDLHLLLQLWDHLCRRSRVTIFLFTTLCYEPSFIIRYRQLLQNIWSKDTADISSTLISFGSFDKFSVLFFFFLNDSLKLSVVLLKNTKWINLYLILRSFCLDCQLKFLKIDFCLWI